MIAPRMALFDVLSELKGLGIIAELAAAAVERADLDEARMVLRAAVERHQALELQLLSKLEPPTVVNAVDGVRVGQASVIALLACLRPRTLEGCRAVWIVLLFSVACLAAALWMHERANDPLHAADMAAPVRK